MKQNSIAIFVEGNDDKQFITRIVKPLIKKKVVHIIKYKNLKKSSFEKYFITFKKNDTPIFVITDLDDFQCVCICKKENKKIYSFLEIDMFIVSCKEIEAWYISGLSKNKSNEVNIKYLKNTDKLSKKDLVDKKIKQTPQELKAFMLSNFNVSEALKRNNSFSYFIKEKLKI